MLIKNIKIENFRSIKKMELDPSKLCALIGPNSTGKTNVLKAIDLVIGEGWTTKAKVARELFNDVTKPLKIELTFKDPVVYEYTDSRSGDTRENSVSSIALVMKYEPELEVKTTINNGNVFYYQDQFKKSCHFIFIPSERNLSSELKVSHWTMLGKLMRMIYDNYVSEYDGGEQDLKDAFAEKIKPAKDFLEDDFSTENVTFRKFSDAFKKHCKENSAGLANEFDPVLDIYNLNWFYKTLQVQVKESFPERHFDSEEVGAGMQNLLLISIFQTYSELMGGRVIFGIEEPEIYLYPQAQRSLFKNFIKLSANTQIFYTTHNPNFVEASRPDDIILLRKDLEHGTYPLNKSVDFNSDNAQDLIYKIYTHFNPERNELFFANKVLLVEGDSDKILFVTLCEEKWNIDLDKKGISIIECGGKGGVAYFIGVCSLIGFEDYFAIWDKDDAIESTILVDSLQKNKAVEIDPNLESFLGLPEGHDSQKVKNAHQWAINTDTIPEEFSPIQIFLDGEVAGTITPDVIEEEISIDEVNIDDIPF